MVLARTALAMTTILGLLMGIGAAMGCVTPTSVIEIPPCADRVEVAGQASRQSATRFELDHTFELPLTKSVITFQAGERRQTVELVSTQPDALRFFAGAASTVGGALLLGGAGWELTTGGILIDDPRALYQGTGGMLLLGVGGTLMLTGWHPPQKYVSFPGACGDEEEPKVTFER